jgi:hypothetical protein
MNAYLQKVSIPVQLLQTSLDMIKSILFAFLLLMFTPKIFCQKTPAEFGATAFYCFQHNKMDSLFRTIPSLTEISGFAKELGIVEGTDAYAGFVKKYPLVIKSFRDKCYQIEADSQSYHFSWLRARVDKIELTEKAMHTNSNPSRDVIFTVVYIYFSSGAQKFLLQFGDLHKYGALWKPGNNVSLTLKYD